MHAWGEEGSSVCPRRSGPGLGPAALLEAFALGWAPRPSRSAESRGPGRGRMCGGELADGPVAERAGDESPV